MLTARIFDVFTDPLMSSLADRTKSRWGTYRPWLIFGALSPAFTRRVGSKRMAFVWASVICLVTLFALSAGIDALE